MRLFIFLLLVILIPSVVFAKTENIYASFKYTMTDNDSKNDARRFAFIEAKKLAVEKAGLFIESDPRIKDYSISKSDIKSYIGAIIDVQIDKEEFDTFSGSQVLTIAVKSVIDVDPVLLTLAIISTDKDLQSKAIKEQNHSRDLEVKLNDLQKRLHEENNGEKAIYLRKYRADILSNMYGSKSEIVSEVDKLQNSINMTSDKVIKYVKNGVTTNELRNLLGKPRLQVGYYDKNKNKSMYCENYGKYWIIIDSGTVIGYVPYNSYTGCNSDVIKQLIVFEDLIK